MQQMKGKCFVWWFCHIGVEHLGDDSTVQMKTFATPSSIALLTSLPAGFLGCRMTEGVIHAFGSIPIPHPLYRHRDYEYHQLDVELLLLVLL